MQTGPAEAQQPGKPPTRTAESLLQAGFGAGSRHFKKAVDRNRIKRLSREAYRLQKPPLLQKLEEKRLSMAIFFIYTGRELPDYGTVTDKIGVALQKLIKEVK
jgi:ribonuclease P protein component